MIYLVYTIHIVVCIFLILVVLLQQGKGADLSVFGGGSTQTVFGARGAATFLHKMTVFGFIAFTLTTISIGLLTGTSSRSVMSGAETSAVVEEVATEAGDEAADEQLEAADPAAPAEEAGADATLEAGDEATPSEPPSEGSNDPQN
jgi:preprotein translocase subunit SecG